MTLHQRTLASPAGDSRAQIASAVRAVEAAMAACEAARLVLISMAQPHVEEEPATVSGECRHPLSQVHEVSTFSGTQYLCGACGERVGV